MMNPGVNVERSSSCGSPTTASHCLRDTCMRGLCFSALCITKIYVPQRTLTPSCPPASWNNPITEVALSAECGAAFTADLVILHFRLDEFTTHSFWIFGLLQAALCVFTDLCMIICAGSFLENLRCSQLFESICMLLASCLIYGRHRGFVLLQAHCFPMRDCIECADSHMAELW